jgi:3-dehydroquinate dehydratase-2
MKLIIINGPNLNLLGSREPGIYGTTDFTDYLNELRTRFAQVVLEYFQSNIEGELINRIQAEGCTADGIILNAAAYTHTSVGIRDAIAAIECPVVEVHISNTAARESFRHNSMITGVCKGLIMGFGLQSYELAIQSFLNAKSAQ